MSELSQSTLLPQLQTQANLLSLNTMALPATAAWLFELDDVSYLSELMAFIETENLPFCVLGSGSNTLFNVSYDGLVILMSNKGIEVVCEDEAKVTVSVQAGEIWDDFLQIALNKNWFGLENLAIIPGTVGAAPVQNIGAYGQEVADCINAVYCFDTHNGRDTRFDKEACQFSYRDSIFKTEYAGRYIITAVEFVLHKTLQANIAYRPLADALEGQDISAKNIRQSVIAIRQSKLPDPAVIANTGSFFKNPRVSSVHFNQLKQQNSDMPGFEVEAEVKLAAGWLIEQCGWKGRSLGPVGMYEKQALVLVNHGGACFADVDRLAKQIQHDVQQRFGVTLEREPVVIA
ncbi:MAG: UDP-N-acetylmuramate dehydrogenase [Pseudomonadales bacterium]|nr:UDP-N-acetylmuramate dehydrogenase [Pseudomonadales bacterium]